MRISVNGHAYEVPEGATIQVTEGRLYVNGQPHDPPQADTSRDFKIEVTGGLASLRVEAGNIINGSVTVHVSGDVAGNIDSAGDVVVTGSSGDVDAGRDVTVGGNVSGSVDAGRDVRCGNVGGDADAERDVHVHKV